MPLKANHIHVTYIKLIEIVYKKKPFTEISLIYWLGKISHLLAYHFIRVFNHVQGEKIIEEVLFMRILA